MPAVDLDELENAMIMVDDEHGETNAWVARDTGIVHVRNNEYMDEEAPLSADVDDDDRYVPVPGIRALDLGKALVFRFTEQQLPGDEHNVREFFRNRGAYARFSRLLETRGATDAWHRFRDNETRAALLHWCMEQGLTSGG